MSTSIHGAAMDPRLPSSTVFAASQSNSSFYTPPSGSSSSFGLCNVVTCVVPVRIVETMLQ